MVNEGSEPVGCVTCLVASSEKGFSSKDGMCWFSVVVSSADCMLQVLASCSDVLHHSS